jgi:hypothetical protein
LRITKLQYPKTPNQTSVLTRLRSNSKKLIFIYFLIHLVVLQVP